MITLDPEMINRHSELLHDVGIDLWWQIMPSIGPEPERRLFFDAYFVAMKHRIGAAVKEALEKAGREQCSQ